MHPIEIESALKTAVFIIDSRERDTAALHKRIEQIALPVERKALNFGDYSIKCDSLDLTDKVCVERKMNLDELAICYTSERKRFEREFARAKEAGAKLYLLVEDGTWSKAYEGRYRSKMSAKAMVASICAWLARYNCQLLFVEKNVSGKLIKDILFRELKEHLERM